MADANEVPDYRRSNFTVVLKSENGGFQMESSGDFSVFDQLGIVEAARALLRLRILSAHRTIDDAVTSPETTTEHRDE